MKKLKSVLYITSFIIFNMSANVLAQENPMYFPVGNGDKISLWGDRLGRTTMYGLGLEPYTFYFKSEHNYRWYITRNADGGNNDVMQLTKVGLDLTGNFRFNSEYNKILFPEKLGFGGGITGDDGNYKRLTLFHGHSIALQTGSNDRDHANTRLYVNGAGNVGIGTVNPGAPLHVGGKKDVVEPTYSAQGMLHIGGGNYDYENQYLVFPNPNVWDRDGMLWWSPDMLFGRYKNEFRWSFKRTHFNNSSVTDIIRADISHAPNYGYLRKVLIAPTEGNVGIGTDDPKNKLSVNGTIWAREIKVSLKDGADWVFEEDYNLRSLEEVEAHITKHKHLPDMPSAEEFRQNDLNVAEMDNRLLQKIEELTLYLINQNDRLKKLEAENEELKKLIGK